MTTKNIIIIGSSTGGIKIVTEMFAPLPVLNAAVVIVQHIGPYYDRVFAERLNEQITMPVALAREGDFLERGRILVAPSDVHLAVRLNIQVELYTDEKVNCCRPSVDVAMRSLQNNSLGKSIGVVLTGMGCDGAEGVRHIKEIGGITIAQNEETSIIYGMPRAAQQTGCVDHVLPTRAIGTKLLELAGEL